ncbi:MAG: hypothetical protein K6E54_03690, partial [Bacteroidaceae bacterium]|nr:hypothetical protein [Bacteroidaceae bacterium]
MKVRIVVNLIWSFISIFGGMLFIKSNYALGLSNQYCKPVPILVKIIFLLIAMMVSQIIIYNFLCLLEGAISKRGRCSEIIITSIPFFVILSAFFMRSYTSTYNVAYFSGDIKNIWDAAVGLYPFLFVYTSEIFLVSFFILP